MFTCLSAQLDGRAAKAICLIGGHSSPTVAAAALDQLVLVSWVPACAYAGAVFRACVYFCSILVLQYHRSLSAFGFTTCPRWRSEAAQCSNPSLVFFTSTAELSKLRRRCVEAKVPAFSVDNNHIVVKEARSEHAGRQEAGPSARGEMRMLSNQDKPHRACSVHNALSPDKPVLVM